MSYLGERYTSDGRFTPEYAAYRYLDTRISQLEQMLKRIEESRILERFDRLERLLADEIKKAEVRELRQKLAKLEKEAADLGTTGNVLED